MFSNIVDFYLERKDLISNILNKQTNVSRGPIPHDGSARFGRTRRAEHRGLYPCPVTIGGQFSGNSILAARAASASDPEYHDSEPATPS